MNIFAVSPNPIKCAEFLDDKRVIKMVLETAQLLSTAIRFHTDEDVAPYKSTHINHPCSIWARETRSNYIWLYEHFLALCEEFNKRRNKKHACEEFIMAFEYGMTFIPQGELTPFPKCVSDIHKNEKDTYLAYQLYLLDKWKEDKRIPLWYGEPKNRWDLVSHMDELDEE